MPALRKRKARGTPNPEPAESPKGSSDSEREKSDEEVSESEHEEVVRSPKRRGPKRARAAEVDADDLSLLDVCKHHAGAASTAAKAWLDRYKRQSDEAVAELLTFIIQVAGSGRKVTTEEVQEGDIDRLVSEVKQEIIQNGLVDLFKEKGHKQFSSAYLRLWDSIVQYSFEQDVLLDDLPWEMVRDLFIALSSSDIRPFRYLGTLTASHLATSLIRIIVVLSEERDTAERQKAAEVAKKGARAAPERARAFDRNVKRCQSQIDNLASRVDEVFKTITTHRFRDICEEIRAVIIDAIGNWAHLHPSTYLIDLYLKYLGWALMDQDGMVRQAAVEALMALYKEKDNLPALGHFTERFKFRLIELPNDIDDTVAVKGVELLTVLVKSEELQYAEVPKSAFQMLLEESAALRSAAAELASELIADSGRQFMLKLQAGQRGRRKSLESYSDEELQLGGLLQIIDTLQPEDVFENEIAAVSSSLAYRIVDAMFDRVAVLQDWKFLTNSLVDDKACERRGEKATGDVIFLLQWAVQKGCGGAMGLTNTAPRFRKLSGKNQGSKDHRQDATMVLSKGLLKLLRKYQSDAVKAGALVGTIRFLKLEIFNLKRDEQGLKDILQTVFSLMNKHTDWETISQCIQALSHCANPEGGPSQEPGRSVFLECVRDLVDRLETATAELMAFSDEDLAAEAVLPVEEESQEAYACRTALLRVKHLLRTSPEACDDPRLSQSLVHIVRDTAKGRNPPLEIAVSAVKCQAVNLLWQLQQQLQDDGAAFPGWPDAVKDFAGLLVSLAQHDEVRVKAVALVAFTDLHTVFVRERFQGAPERLREAALKASQDVVSVLWNSAEEVLAYASHNAEASDGGEVASPDDGLGEEGDLHVKSTVIAGFGRLVVNNVVPFSSQLPGRIVSHLASPDEPVAAVARDVLQHLKKLQRPISLPKVYLEALQTAFERDRSDPEPLLQLSHRIARMISSFVANAQSTAVSILEGGITYAFKGRIPEGIPFLKSLLPIVNRATAANLVALGDKLEAAGHQHHPEANQAEWEGYIDLLAALRDNKGKQKVPRSALKKPGSTSKAKVEGRRISFKDAGKRQRASGRQAARRQYDESDSTPDERSDRDDAAGPPRPITGSQEPRFHSKTRRGSQAAAQRLEPGLAAAQEEEESLDDSGNGQGEAEDFSNRQTYQDMEIEDTLPDDEMAGASPGNGSLADAQQSNGLPSSLFMTGTDSDPPGTIGQEELDEDSEMQDSELQEEEMLRIKTRRAI